MNVAQLLERAARAWPDRTAVFLGTQARYDYAELRDRVAALAAGLRDLGAASGDRVLVVMDNRVEYLETLFAIWWAGLVAVPVNAKLHPAEVAWILRDSDAALVVTDVQRASALRTVLVQELAGLPMLVADGSVFQAVIAAGCAVPEQLPQCASASVTDLAWLFYTSGTTGRPKGVMLAHRQLLAMAVSYLAEVQHVDAGDRTLYAAPMSHGAGMYSLAFVARGAGHVVPASGRFDPAEVCDIAAALGNVSLFAAPTMLNRLVAEVRRRQAEARAADPGGSGPAGLPSGAFGTIVYGGGPMYVDDLVAARAVLGDCLAQIYGQGESPMTISTLSREAIADESDPAWSARIAGVGRAFAFCDLTVVDASGSPLPVGATGEIVVRGDTVMLGYWRNPTATAAAIRDGWLFTGDTGCMDEQGYLTLKDRSKDMIISGGTNIYPREVEEVLLRHPAVAQVAVIGRRDPEWGESVVACVVAGDPVTAAELDRFCREHIAGFKRPKDYHFLAALPTNEYGKVLKTALRSEFGMPVTVPDHR